MGYLSYQLVQDFFHQHAICLAVGDPKVRRPAPVTTQAAGLLSKLLQKNSAELCSSSFSKGHIYST